MLWNLLRAEWVKLARRPMSWTLLAVFLGLMLLYYGLWFMVVALHLGTFTGGEIRMEILTDEQVAELRRQLSFPGIFGSVLGQVNSVGGICAIILAGASLGSEYNWGTLRLQLTHQPRRGLVLVAKILALLLVILAAIGLGLAFGSLLALIFGGLLGLPQAVSARDVLVLPLGVARAMFVMLPYVLFAVACAALGRSAVAGVGGGLIFLAFDIGLGSLNALSLASPLVRLAVNLLIQPNINTMVVLNSQLYGLDQTVIASALDLGALPSPLQATLVIALYSASFFLTALRLVTRRDVGGAA